MDASTLFDVHDVRVSVLGGVLILVYDIPYVHFVKHVEVTLLRFRMGSRKGGPNNIVIKST